MKKMPCVFKREFPEKGKQILLQDFHDDCLWVRDGEGIATRKWDGTAVMFDGGTWWKRYDAKRGKTPPAGFTPCGEPDEVTGHHPGWVPVDAASPSDQWIVAAIGEYPLVYEIGTYEAIGEKINGNNERIVGHTLEFHGGEVFLGIPRDFEGLRDFLKDRFVEGIVFHHVDGRRAKIRRSDFGFDWPVKVQV